MSLDPEFVKKIQERKAKREALEKKLGSNPKPARKGSSKSGGPSKGGPVFRSVSMLTGEETYITGEDAQRRVKKGTYNG